MAPSETAGFPENSVKYEDRAMDLHLFKQVLLSTHGSCFNPAYTCFIRGYRQEMGNKAEKILSRIDKIELRGRYIPKTKRRN